ncbi:MAG: SGNH/GDSL hydrolase family protein [Saprospiraceae bacterium]|nr:SGNH/GDSL hydrolase family protein [Saprospiraceae bacterium]
MNQEKNITETDIKLILSGEIGPESISKIESKFNNIKYYDFKPLIKRIFDLGEGYPLNHSSADIGIMGRLNRIGRKRKNRKFLTRYLTNKTKKEAIVIVSEGDSWFEYPLFLKDIVDWLIKLTKYSVYSIASGGDWLGNILYNGDYIHELSLYRPDVFLISGGGNDLVGGSRISLLVKERKDIDIELSDAEKTLYETYLKAGYQNEYAHKLIIGRKFLNKDFWALLNVFRFQYYLIFKNLESSGKFNSLKIITQGYEAPLPSSNRNILINPMRAIMKNGRWLDQPLRLRGIQDTGEKRAILATMMHEFNEMLIDIGKKNKNVFHIDCRGFAKNESDWFDELHLKSKFFKQIALTYIECIESKDSNKKVFRVASNKP